MDSITSSIFEKHLTNIISSPFSLNIVTRPKPLTYYCSTNNTSSIRANSHTHHPQPKTREPTTRKRSKYSLTSLFDSFDDFICKFLDPPLNPSIDPKVVLSENFAPTCEIPPTPCEIEHGSLPTCLDGAYIRNGPNPHLAPRGPHHLFDGDGMLHVIKISKGHATLCSRYVKTYKYGVEREAGSPLVLNYFAAFTGTRASLARLLLTAARILARQYRLDHGTGVANTSLARFGGKLFALCESDLPYEVKVTREGDVVTLGREERLGHYSLALQSMTAHPKVDTDTGEAFAFRHSTMPPYLSYFTIDKDGVKEREVSIFSQKRPSLVHDFFITKNYAIFPVTPCLIDPFRVMKGRQMIGVDINETPRLGMIPRYAKDESEMRWVDVPGLSLVHATNAWEEGGGERVVLVAPNVLSMEHMLERPDLIYSMMERVEINVKNMTVSRRPISMRNLEFAVINPTYVGKKNRYVYAAQGAPFPKIKGVVKLDVSLSTTDRSIDCVVASRVYEPGCYGGEPYFMAKEPDNPNADEDDGYLVTYVCNETTKDSKFLVMDAKSPSLEIVASVKLPHRVPYGFHGIFLRDCELEKLM